MSELLQVVRPMRATVEAKAFSDALKNAKALLRKSVIPFLEEVYVQFSGGTCILTGTDLNSWIISELPAQGDDFAFVFSRTKDVERACRYFDGTLTLEMTETQRGVISLSCGSRTGEFEIYPAETYPAVPKPKGRSLSVPMSLHCWNVLKRCLTPPKSQGRVTKKLHPVWSFPVTRSLPLTASGPHGT